MRTPARALILVLLALAASRAPAQDRYDLRERHVRGLRKTCAATFQASLELEASSEDGGVFQRQHKTYESTERRLELATEVDAEGRPTRIVRTYVLLRGKTKESTRGMFDDPPEENEWEENDERAGKVLRLEVDPEGRSTVLETRPGTGLDDPGAVEVPSEPRLLPDRAVAIGESWSIPAGRLVTPWIALAGSGKEGGAKPGPATGSLTGRLESVDGSGVATIALSGAATFPVEWTSSDGTHLQTTRTTATYEGTLRFDPALGRPLELAWKATLEREELLSWMTSAGKGSLEETRTYTYGTVVEDEPDNGEDGPADVERPWTAPLAKVDPAHVVVLRHPAGRGPRLVVFDPANRTTVKTLAILPSALILRHPSLSPGRDRIAFVSNLNNEISHAVENVFVLDLPSGRIDQVTPAWASGQGLARPFAAERTGRIVGRIQWQDDRGIVRSDLTTGSVRADGVAGGAVIGAGGSFVLEGVPVQPLLLYVRATGSQTSGIARLQAHRAIAFGSGDVADAGTIFLSAVWTDRSYDFPTWRGDGIVGRAFGLGRVFECGHPERRFDESRTIPDLSDETGVEGPIASPDGKRLASYAEGGFLIHDAATGERLHGLGFPEIDLLRYSRTLPTPGQQGVWLPDSDVGMYAGTETIPSLSWPGLVGFKISTNEILRPWAWPEACLAGRSVVSVGLDPPGDVAYLVVHTPSDDHTKTFGDLYAWDSTKDETRRLTTFGDVVDVTNVGR